MKIEELLKEASKLSYKLDAALKEMKLPEELYEIRYEFESDMTQDDIIFYSNKLAKAFEHLNEAVNIIAYINRDITGEYIIHKDLYGKYGCSAITYSAGTPIEALIVDGENQFWVQTTVEHNGNDYYLVRYPNVQLEGLKVRIRW